MADSTPNAAASDRESRAREWIRALTDIPERFAGTIAERIAAERISAVMGELGVRDVSIAPVPSGARTGLVLAAHAGLGLVGCYWGGLLGTLLAAFAMWSFYTENRSRSGQGLSRLFRPADSVNVTGRSGSETATRRLVLSAHIDAAQAGVLFSRQLADFFGRLSLGARRHGNTAPAGPLALPEALLVGAALIAFAMWAGAHGALFGLIRGAVMLGLLVAIGLGVQWATSKATPGANDNASAVAAMLLCAEQLLPKLPHDVELWLVGTGAEEVGCRGMHAFVDSHSQWPHESTYFVNFECVGGGTLHFIRSEGLLGKVNYPPMLDELARRVAASGTFGEITPTHLLAATDGHVPAEHGYPALSLISLEENGVPRNYHRPNDTVENLDMTTVVRAADFGAAVAYAALQGEAGPVIGPQS